MPWFALETGWTARYVYEELGWVDLVRMTLLADDRYEHAKRRSSSST